MDIRALLWDMDGVIADTAPFHFEAWRQAARDRGIEFTEADFRQTFGKRNPEIIAEKIDPDMPPEEAAAFALEKEEVFRRLAGEGAQPFPGVLDLLRAAGAAGWRMAIASSTPAGNIEMLTRTLGIAGLFDAAVSDQDVSRGKPDPECFLIAAARLGAAPHRCVVIEDAVAGVEAAGKAGMKCIAVTNTHPAASLNEADLVVASLEEVTTETLESLLG
jgi:beta-phosphoglucomutase family hydrolase